MRQKRAKSCSSSWKPGFSLSCFFFWTQTKDQDEAGKSSVRVCDLFLACGSFWRLQLQLQHQKAPLCDLICGQQTAIEPACRGPESLLLIPQVWRWALPNCQTATMRWRKLSNFLVSVKVDKQGQAQHSTRASMRERLGGAKGCTKQWQQLLWPAARLVAGRLKNAFRSRNANEHEGCRSR